MTDRVRAAREAVEAALSRPEIELRVDEIPHQRYRLQVAMFCMFEMEAMEVVQTMWKAIKAVPENGDTIPCFRIAFLFGGKKTEWNWDIYNYIR